MLGDARPIDPTKPNTLRGLTGEISDGQVRLKWDPATDPTPGSWVVSYRVYRDAKLLRTTYGTKFREPAEEGVEHSYVVRAVNGSGLESEGSLIVVRPQK